VDGPASFAGRTERGDLLVEVGGLPRDLRFRRDIFPSGVTSLYICRVKTPRRARLTLISVGSARLHRFGSNLVKCLRAQVPDRHGHGDPGFQSLVSGAAAGAQSIWER
jgi:hypothetical protein